MMEGSGPLTSEYILGLDSEQLELQLRAQPKIFADALADAVRGGRLSPQQLSQMLFSDKVETVSVTGQSLPMTSVHQVVTTGFPVGKGASKGGYNINSLDVSETNKDASSGGKGASSINKGALNETSESAMGPFKIRVYVAGNSLVGKTALIEKWVKSFSAQIVLTISGSLEDDGAIDVSLRSMSGDVVLSCKYDWKHATDSIWDMVAERKNVQKSKIKLVLPSGHHIQDSSALMSYFESIRDGHEFSGELAPEAPAAYVECSNPVGLVLEFEFRELQQGIQTKIGGGTTAAGALLVFSVTDKDSYAGIRAWNKALGCSETPVVLLGNKVDVRDYDRQVSVRDITLHRKYSWQYYDVSAASGYNITKPLQWLARRVVGDCTLQFSSEQ